MKMPECKDCKFMKPLHNHCTFPGAKKGGCICDSQLVIGYTKAFVCFAPELDNAHIMTQNGGCEMFESKK